MRNASRFLGFGRAIIISQGLIPAKEFDRKEGDDMADTIALDDAVREKVAKLDEKISKLKDRIAADTAQCAKLSAKRDVLVFRSIKTKYGLEGQALADMILREHEQAQKLGADNKPDAKVSNAVSEKMVGQLSFDDEKKNPYAD